MRGELSCLENCQVVPIRRIPRENAPNLEYDSRNMPSWNIHTALVEHLLDAYPVESLGIADANSFLFGNYVPDIYLGFMVKDTTYRLDYCLTHLARPNTLPVANPDQFWDECLWTEYRRPETEEGMSLALGVWTHLMADRTFNMRARQFCQTHDAPVGKQLLKRKQADFDIFGRSLGITSHVQITPKLLDAAKAFRQYSILPDDVKRTIDVADAIVDAEVITPSPDDYQMLNEGWLNDTFAICHDQLALWLQTRMRLLAEGATFSAEDVRACAGLPPAEPDDLNWMHGLHDAAPDNGGKAQRA